MTTVSNNTRRFAIPECFLTFTQDILKNNNGNMLTVFYSFNMLFVFVMNTALIIGLVQTKNKTMTRSNKLFIFLSVSDLSVGLVLMPLLLYHLQISPDISCLEVAVRAFWVTFPVILSGTHILLISVDRYLMIAMNNWYKKRFTDKVVLLLIVIEVLIAFSWGFGYAFITQGMDLKKTGTYFICLGIFEAIILTLAMKINLMVRATVYATTAKTTTLQLNQKNYSRRLSTTILFITISLVICYMPSVIALIATGVFFFYSTNPTHIRNIIIALIWSLLPASLNSGLNSTIYVLRNTRIRKYYKSLINGEESQVHEHCSTTMASKEHTKINSDPQKLYTSEL